VCAAPTDCVTFISLPRSFCSRHHIESIASEPLSYLPFFRFLFFQYGSAMYLCICECAALGLSAVSADNIVVINAIRMRNLLPTPDSAAGHRIRMLYIPTYIPRRSRGHLHKI